MFPREAMARMGNTSWSVFYASTSTNATGLGYQVYHKPPGCQWLFMWAIAGGSGGGKPNDGPVTVGAGGGGCSNIVRFLAPAAFLPDTLYVKVGLGGAGATVAGSGTAGETTNISAAPIGMGQTPTQNILISPAGTAGSGGTSSAAGSAAAGATANLSAFGLFSSVQGQAGAAGATAANANATNLISNVVSGGSGGGNGTGTGGPYSNSGGYPISTITGAPGGTNGTNGASSPFINRPIMLGPSFTALTNTPFNFFLPGLGGGGSTTGQAGNGGDGSYGCGGGGGGGASTAGGLSGNGGRGGDGLVIIGAF